jgi:hypothetical protein
LCKQNPSQVTADGFCRFGSSFLRDGGNCEKTVQIIQFEYIVRTVLTVGTRLAREERQRGMSEKP